MERDGLTSALEDVGALVLANACGPCIGQVCSRFERNQQVLITHCSGNARNPVRRTVCSGEVSPYRALITFYSNTDVFQPVWLLSILRATIN
jgi:hypothetical protein